MEVRGKSVRMKGTEGIMALGEKGGVLPAACGMCLGGVGH